MSIHTKIGRYLGIIIACFSISTHADVSSPAMVVFGDSFSDNGNTTHLLKSLRQEESPAYLVYPLKQFIVNKMEEFANTYSIPQLVLTTGEDMVEKFFDTEFGPFLASLISKIKLVEILPGKPYWQDRFSNGRVWNEYLAVMLGVDKEDDHQYLNQAFAGSWAVTYTRKLTLWNLIRHPINTIKDLIVGKLIPPSFGLTMQAYLMSHASLNQDAIYFIFTGNNDYLNSLKFADNYDSSVVSDYIDNVLQSIGSGVEKLIGSDIHHIVIMGLPPLGFFPKYQDSIDQATVNTIVREHNERLQQKIAEWHQAYPELNLTYVSLDDIWNGVIQTAGQLGFTNTKEACINIKFPLLHQGPPSPFADNSILLYSQTLHQKAPFFRVGEKNYQVCGHPERYLYWDDVHPTTRAYHYIAYGVCEAMKKDGYQITCLAPPVVSVGAN